MHTPKKRNKKYVKEKSCYSDPLLEIAVLTPPRKHQKSSFSISDAFKKETVHRSRRYPILVSTLKKVVLTLSKQCLQ